MKLPSLKIRFALAMSAIVLTLVVGLAALALHHAKKDLLMVMSGQQLALVSRAGDDLDGKLKLAMEALSATAASIPPASLESTSSMRSVLAERPALRAIFDDLLIVNVDGIVRGDAPPNDLRIGLNVGSRAYFKRVLATGQPTISEPVRSKLNGDPLVTFGAPIRNAGGNIVAVLVGLIRLNKPNFVGHLGSATIGHTGYFEVISTWPKPQFVVHPNPERILQEFSASDSRALSKVLNSAAMGTAVSTVEDGSKVLIAYRPLAMTNWILVAVLPSEEAFGLIEVAKERSIAMAIISAVVLVPLIWLLAWRLLKPLSELRNQVDRLAERPDVHARVGEGRHDEAGQLARAFNRLLERQWITEASRLQGETATRQSEARMASIADSLPMLVAFMDRECKYRFVNSRYEDFFGRSRSEIIGRTLEEITSADVAAAYQPYFARAAQGETVVFDRESVNPPIAHFNVKIIPQFDDGQGLIGFHVMHQDVTDYKLEQQRLSHLASLDRLTGLVNRAGFEAGLDEGMHRSVATGNCMALFYLDVDCFKSINDTHGHQSGDALLRAFAARLTDSVRATDVVARLGGDEFVVIAENLRCMDDVHAVAQKILRTMRRAFEVNGVTVSITTSIGVAVFNGEAIEAEALIARADAALYGAKRAGRDCYRLAGERVIAPATSVGPQCDVPEAAIA